MIVDEPPYELVALFADEDARRMMMKVIERGQTSGCIRAIRWRALRDPRRDTVARAAGAVLRPFRRDDRCRYAVLWDRHGSGWETESAPAAESTVIDDMVRAGFAVERVFALCLEPELEVTLIPAWSRVLDLLAQQRRRAAPTDEEMLSELLGDTSIQARLQTQPKEVLEAALRVLNLRHSPALFDVLGEKLSIPSLKQGDGIGRLTAALVAWFPPG